MQNTPHYDIHVCLVSEQNFPNLMPFLDNDFRPEKVLLCVTEKMTVQADRLEKAIHERYAAVRIERMHISDAYNIESTFNEISEWLDNTECLKEPGKTIALNATCGTKPMAMAAVAAFDAAGSLPVFYCDYNRVQLMNVSGLKAPKTIALNVKKWPIQSYLTAYGYSAISSIEEPAKLDPDVDSFARDVLAHEELWKGIGTLNFFAEQAKDQSTLTATGYQGSESFGQLQGKIYHWVTVDDDKIIFTSESARRLMNGGWLEDVVTEACRGLPVNSLVENLLIRSDADPKNEFDVAFIYKGQLHIIEVKTCNFEEHDNDNQNKLHKLNSLGRVLGHTKLCFVSLRKLPQSMMNHAKALGITVLHGQQLRTLREHLKDWIK